MLTVLIFSHSDYSYLWPIIEETIAPLGRLTPIFLSNKTALEKPKGFERYLEYDDRDCYAVRWLSVLPQITSKYILVVHDVNIIVNCVVDKLLSLTTLIDNNSIDRCSMNVFKSNQYIETEDGIRICNLITPGLESKTYVPFDVMSAIWNRDSFYKLWKTFPSETYRGSEQNQTLQGFCRQNFKCFGIQLNETETINICIGRPYYNMFKILHITIQGEIMFPVDVYNDTKGEFLYFFEKYKLGDKIKINNTYEWLIQYNKPYN